MTPTFTTPHGDCSYEPKNHLSRLDWFHLAECARRRMTENVTDIHRWRGERRSFYSALSAMKVDEVSLVD